LVNCVKKNLATQLSNRVAHEIDSHPLVNDSSETDISFEAFAESDRTSKAPNPSGKTSKSAA
jgi:hypothetical protein